VTTLIQNPFFVITLIHIFMNERNVIESKKKWRKGTPSLDLAQYLFITSILYFSVLIFYFKVFVKKVFKNNI